MHGTPLTQLSCHERCHPRLHVRATSRKGALQVCFWLFTSFLEIFRTHSSAKLESRRIAFMRTGEPVYYTPPRLTRYSIRDSLSALRTTRLNGVVCYSCSKAEAFLISGNAMRGKEKGKRRRICRNAQHFGVALSRGSFLMSSGFPFDVCSSSFS